MTPEERLEINRLEDTMVRTRRYGRSSHTPIVLGGTWRKIVAAYAKHGLKPPSWEWIEARYERRHPQENRNGRRTTTA
jgi:hypothetical protein